MIHYEKPATTSFTYQIARQTAQHFPNLSIVHFAYEHHLMVIRNFKLLCLGLDS